MSACLDAFAVLAWLQDEPGAALTEALLERADREESFHCFISIVNLGEVYYRVSRSQGSDEADAFWQDSQQHVLPLKIARVTEHRVLQAARLKAHYPIALGDAFAIQLAQEMGVPLVTGDPEMKPLEDDQVLKVVWLDR